MKKILLFFAVAFMAVTILSSCNKKDDGLDPKSYASFVSGDFVPSEGDIYLKSADLAVGGHWFDVLDKKVGSLVYTRVNGTEFLPGSAPALDWANFTSPVWFSPQSVRCTYCPILPLRVVLKTSKDNNLNSPVSYLGLWDGTPNANSFPITVNCRRLGDKLTLNTDALTSLPGYSNMSFTVSYNKDVIDVDKTILDSPGDTQNNWPTYSYSATNVPVSVNLPKKLNGGDQEIYDGFDYKISGTITITIHVDGINILKTTESVGLGKGLAITLTTDKVGWFDSGNMGVSETDIELVQKQIPVN